MIRNLAKRVRDAYRPSPPALVLLKVQFVCRHWRLYKKITWWTPRRVGDFDTCPVCGLRRDIVRMWIREDLAA